MHTNLLKPITRPGKRGLGKSLALARSIGHGAGVSSVRRTRHWRTVAQAGDVSGKLRMPGMTSSTKRSNTDI
jgi:hypothetical protein